MKPHNVKERKKVKTRKVRQVYLALLLSTFLHFHSQLEGSCRNLAVDRGESLRQLDYFDGVYGDLAVWTSESIPVLADVQHEVARLGHKTRVQLLPRHIGLLARREQTHEVL